LVLQLSYDTVALVDVALVDVALVDVAFTSSDEA
jgi:hypothetical protein